MENTISRPLAVWLAQILLLGIALLLLSVPVTYFFDVEEELNYYGISASDASAPLVKTTLVTFAIVVPFVLAALFAFWGLAGRKQFGRWISLTILFLAFLFSASLLLLKLQGIAVGQPLETTDFVRLIILPCLMGTCILLMLRLAFGNREKLFFNLRKPFPATEPPPPPSFDA